MRLGLLTRVTLPAAVTTAAATPLVRCLMLRAGTMDVPNHRSSHTTPTPRGGGLACLAGMTFGLREMPPRASLPVIALGLVGLGDDVSSGLSPAVRLAAQASLGSISAPSPLQGLVLVPAAVNIVNFMDGINGISGLTALVWGLNAAAVGPTRSVAALGAATAGAGLGFLPWNIIDAKVFLGDVGSYSLGAAMGVVVARASTFAELVRLGAPLAPYVMDAAQAIIRRRRAGQCLHEAHREHAYQRLVDRTPLTHAHVALLHAAAASSCAVVAARLRPAPGMVAVTAIATAYALLPLRIGH